MKLRKFKRTNKREEQIKEELKQKELIEHKRLMARDILYPALLRGSNTINHAKVICETIKTVIYNEQNKTFKTKTLKEMALDKSFESGKDVHLPDKQVYLDIIKGFENENLEDCIQIIGGMAGEIERLVSKENHERKLDTLKTDFYGNKA